MISVGESGLQQQHAEPRAQILATFDALDQWSQHHTRGCAMLNAASELSDSAHPAHTVITDQKRWLHQLYTELLGRAGLNSSLAVELLVLHEGAVAVHHAGSRTDAMARARRAAAALLDHLVQPVGE